MSTTLVLWRGVGALMANAFLASVCTDCGWPLHRDVWNLSKHISIAGREQKCGAAPSKLAGHLSQFGTPKSMFQRTREAIPWQRYAFGSLSLAGVIVAEPFPLYSLAEQKLWQSSLSAHYSMALGCFIRCSEVGI